MSNRRPLQNMVPIACANDMRKAIGLSHVPADGAVMGLLGMQVKFELTGAAPTSDLVILCAQPVDDTNWDFGSAFPQLPGSWGSQGGGMFHLRFLSLEKSLWIYIWSRTPDIGPVETALKTNSIFTDWATDEKFDLDANGLAATDLLEVPRKRRKLTVATPAKTHEDPSFSSFQMWGELVDSKTTISTNSTGRDVAQTVAISTVMTGLHAFLEREEQKLIFRVRLLYDIIEGRPTPPSYVFRRLSLSTPPLNKGLGGGLDLQNATLFLTAPLFFSQDNTHVGVTADLDFDGREIHLELDYPITGDLIRAKGRYLGDPAHLLGDHANMGLPDAPKAAGSDTELTLDLEISKSAKSLTKAAFDFELRNKDWTLIPAPINLALEGVIVRASIFNPLKTDGSRFVQAQLAVATKFGAADAPLHLFGGGRYPQGDIYLQCPDTLPVGKLLEKLVGPNPALEKFTLQDLRIEHNLNTGASGVSFAVPETWSITNSIELGGLEFRVQGGPEGYQGGASAELRLDMGDSGPLGIDLAAVWADGWHFEGNTGAGQDIPIGHLFSGLVKTFGLKDGPPDCLDAMTVSELSLAFSTKTHDFEFRALVEMDFNDETPDEDETDENPVTLDLSIAITHHPDPSDPETKHTEMRLTGIIRFSVGVRDFELDVVFDRGEIKVPSEGDVSFSTLLASLKSTDGEPPTLRDFAPAPFNKIVPVVATKSVLVARQSRKPKSSKDKPTSKWLIALSLDAGLDLSKAKLPSLPLVGSGGQPGSLKLDLQILLPGPKASAFDALEVAQIGKASGGAGIDLPAGGIKGLAVASTITMDGSSLHLNLPLSVNSDRDQPALSHNPSGANLPTTRQPVPNMAASADGMKWINIQKSFGPIHIGRIGLKYKDEKLFVAFDAGLTAAGFTISLHGLGLDTPLTEFDPDFYISGLGLDYASGGVEIGAAFLKQDMIDPDDATQTYTAYSGEAVLKTASISMSALGSFAKYRGESSLFVYATLDAALGGPAFFFVTGLAAGFGYHRRAILPAIDQIHTYPLVTKAIAGPASRDANGKAIKPDLATELGQLEAFLPPDAGSLFFAVGVKFSSFELIDSFALLVGQFGAHTAFDVLGVSHMQIPAKPAGSDATGSPLAEIYMNWHGYLHPDEGAMGLEAQLAPGSFVLSHDCHLTGGFAYASWFSGPHEGDFVLTVGGYHRDYIKPAHYPVVPRLGFNWVLPSANLTIKGEMYFALTADAFMVGGALNASIHGGFDIGIAGVSYHADLSISADFLITWEPYHYDGRASIDLDIGLTAHLMFFSKSFSLNIGGDIHFWGPEFAGDAHLNLKVWKIHHTISMHFGAGPAKLLPITWDRFATSLLPKAKRADQDILSVAVPSGLVSQTDDRWIINPREFCLETNATIPSNQAIVGDRTVAENGTFHDLGPDGATVPGSPISQEFGIAPMGLEPEQITSVHTLFVTLDKKFKVDHLFRAEPIVKSMPKGMWGKPKFDDAKHHYLAKPELEHDPDGGFVPNVLTGLRVLPSNTLHPTSSQPIDRRELRYDTDRVGDAFTWCPMPLLKSDTLRAANKVLAHTQTPRARRDNEPLTPAERRAKIAKEMGLQHAAIHFANGVDSGRIDDPQIEAL